MKIKLEINENQTEFDSDRVPIYFHLPIRAVLDDFIDKIKLAKAHRNEFQSNGKIIFKISDNVLNVFDNAIFIFSKFEAEYFLLRIEKMIKSNPNSEYGYGFSFFPDDVPLNIVKDWAAKSSPLFVNLSKKIKNEYSNNSEA